MKESVNVNQHLEDYLKYYYKLHNPQYAVLINGKWGCGKTFFIKNQIKKWQIDTKDDIPENLILQPIYVSLNGISKTYDITLKIKETLNPILYSKSAKILKKVFFGVLKTAAHINFDSDGDGNSDGKISFNIDTSGLLRNENDNIKGKKVLIFDDLERCKIEISELFGYINDFVEHYQCKVIILSDEEKVYKAEEKNSYKITYKDFKEKLIGQTFTLQPNIEKAVKSFLERSDIPIFLNENISFIIEVFQASKIQNLRILKQSLIDFSRLKTHFNSSITKKDNYDEFLKNILGHFLLVYLEYKNGNQSIGKLSSYNFEKDQQELDRNIGTKYLQVFTINKIFHRRKLIEYMDLAKFIENGYLDENSLNEKLLQNEFFRIDRVENWEKLYAWEELEDPDFKVLFKEVSNNFFTSKINNPYKLIHITTIIFSLINESIIDEDFENVKKVFKDNFIKILSLYPNEAFTVPSDHSWSKSYRARDLNHFNEIIDFSREQIILHNAANKNDYLKNIFENLNNDNIEQLEENLDTMLPDRSTTYNNVPILVTVDGENLAKNLIDLNLKNLNLFFGFLERRYFPEKIYANGHLQNFNVEDLPCLIELRDEIKKNLENFDTIKKYNFKRFITLLYELIEKLEKMNDPIE